MTDLERELLEALEEAANDLHDAASQFQTYAALHRQKATPEGDEKAARNQLLADTLFAQCSKIDHLTATAREQTA